MHMLLRVYIQARAFLGVDDELKIAKQMVSFGGIFFH